MLCVVIKHLYLKGLTSKEIKVEFDEVHGTSAPVFATVCNWVNDFKRGHTSTKGEHLSVHPVEVTTPEMIDKIHNMILKLSVKKISARWVPRLLSKKNKRNRVVDSEAILVLFRRNLDEFLPR